jgi:hypothetical protein
VKTVTIRVPVHAPGENLRLRRLCRLLRAAGALLALDGTRALRCVPHRLLHPLAIHTSSRAPSYAASGARLFTGKTRAGPNARSGGRSRDSELGVRARDTTERVVCSHRDDPGGEASPRGPC